EGEQGGVQGWVGDRNAAYGAEPALYELDCQPEGFTWIDCSDAVQSTLVYLRRGRAAGDVVVVACNFTPVPRHGFRIGVPFAGWWHEVLNSDAEPYGGSGQGNFGGAKSEMQPWHGHPQSLGLTLPPLGILGLKTPAPARASSRSASRRAPPCRSRRPAGAPGSRSAS